MSNLMQELFGVAQPVIAMAHFPALPARRDMTRPWV